MRLATRIRMAPVAAAVVFALAGGIVRAGAADFPFVGDGTDRSPYRISSAADWDALSALIEEGANTQRFQFKQTEDFTVSTMLGTGENPFKGVYDGGGRTLTVSIASDADYAAPFRWIHQATIRNLNVAGSVSGPDFASGLVGGIAAVEGRTSNGRIENCGVSVNVESSHGGEHAGGVVGHGGTSKAEIVGCVFSGGIAGAKYAGTLWGWSDDGARPMLEYCLDVSRSDHPIGIGGGLPDVYSVYYTNPDKGYRSRLDLESFLRYFLVGEFAGNNDAMWSIYLYKERDDDRFHFGPVWDFDLSMDNDQRTYPANGKPDWLFNYGSAVTGIRDFVRRILSDPYAAERLSSIWADVRKSKAFSVDSLWKDLAIDDVKFVSYLAVDKNL